MTLSRWLILLGALAIAAFVAIAVGTISVPLSAVVDALRGVTDSTPAMVVSTLRLPRVALAVLVGAGLGMSGAALQGTMRNPLAEPYLLGVSGGAAVGAVIAVVAGAPFAFVPIAAFVGALAAGVGGVFGLRWAPAPGGARGPRLGGGGVGGAGSCGA